ncbi:MAG: substrate-binding domain-containing protein [Planctomycetaceae bacterium]
MWSFVRSALFAALAAGCAGEVPKPVTTDPGKSGSAGQTDSGNTGTKEAGDVQRIMFITNGDAPFWDACQAGMDDGAKKFKLREAGYKAVFVRNDGTVRGHIDKLRQFATQSDVAAVAISVISPKNAAFADELKKLMAKGIQVITVDSDIDRKQFRDARTYYIGTDNLKGGRVLGMCVKHLRPAGGDYATFVGYNSAQNAMDRINGFAEGTGPKFKSKDSLEDLLEYKKGVENTRTALTNHPSLNTLVGIYAYNGPAIVDVIREKGTRSKYTIVTFDADPRSVKLMGDGMIDAMVVQDPYHMGYYSVRMLKAMLTGDQADLDRLRKELPGDKDIFDTPLKVIVPDADSPLKKDVFPKEVEFHTLGDFKKWLDEYGLSGS